MQRLRALSDRCDCLVFENDYWAIILSSLVVSLSCHQKWIFWFQGIHWSMFISIQQIVRWSQIVIVTTKWTNAQTQWYPKTDDTRCDHCWFFFQPVLSCLFSDFVVVCSTISSFFVERFRRSLLNDFFAVCSTISLLIEWFLSFFPQMMITVSLGFSPCLSPFSFLC